MLVRILTALVGIPIILGLLYVGWWPLFALAAGMGLIGFHEYVRMWQQKGIHVARVPGFLSVLGLLLWAFLAPDNAAVLGAVLSFAGLSTLTWLIFRYEQRNVVDALVTLAGIVYVGFLLSHLLLLRQVGGTGRGLDLGLKWLAFAFFSTWAADSFAYFAGRAFGNRKLAPLISPNKSVEGAIGGGVGTLALGAFYAPVLAIAPWQGALIALGAFALSVLGDLAESALKRYTGVKDSGSLLPGHGGVLDRFDSSLFTLPFVYYVARLFFF
ncbi:MAG TPA: phosphatidate cytidylyltransferase [Symbiobacteriaceae bacterium]|nr:phosphatidate cytidylyltransferase [Symbiobacteriaceae bacterium]